MLVHEVGLEHPSLDEVFSTVTDHSHHPVATAASTADQREYEDGGAARAGSCCGGVLDAYTATRRFLIRGKRQPDVIFGSLLTRVIFVVLFGYVFGSSIRLPGGGIYRSYLMPGLFAMTVLFNVDNVAVSPSPRT